ncbi:UNVERIFIED_CONTAM: hypothetical protein K2H54_039181 [Gekko kuhli]
MLPLVWGLWCLIPLMRGGTAAAAFLPFSAEGIFRAFSNLMELNQEALASEQFDSTVDISKLPPNYHNKEEKQRKMGNATLYSHHEINKVTDNRTGEMIFSEKTVTSIEQGDTLPEKKKVPKPVASQKETDPEADRQIDGVRFFTESPPQPRPRLTFLIFRFPHRLRTEQMTDGSWTKEKPISDRKHRLLAIRNGLLTAPRPIKKKTLPVAPQEKFVPRKHHFFFFWRKI